MLETIGKFVAQNWRIPVEIGILTAVLYYIYKYLRRVLTAHAFS